ncbi:MAG: hypothetical protein A4E35_00237 [Methanoregula sp. PtaU1.Bin051]|nr:MAG: hypothetical protein A4E35_00237 [Methanoregula sp. PtaU1.Bin051]
MKFTTIVLIFALLVALTIITVSATASNDGSVQNVIDQRAAERRSGNNTGEGSVEHVVDQRAAERAGNQQSPIESAVIVGGLVIAAKNAYKFRKQR